MRNGKLIIKKKTTFKVGDRCFDSIGKVPIVIDVVEKGDVYGKNMLTGNPLKVLPECLVDILVKDTIEESFFELSMDQQAFLFKNESKDMFKFYTVDNLSTNMNEAVVLCKEIEMMSMIIFMAPIADSYGLYVAGQKAISEPSKNFRDWYFNISI